MADGLLACVGRDQELARLEALAEAAVGDGQGRIAYLCGPPGIGKTRLADELARRLAGRGQLVASGRCRDGARAWQPVLEIVERVARALSEAGAPALARRGHDLCAALEGRAPDDGERAPGPVRLQLFERAAVFLADASRVTPLCVIVHDAHLADGGSRALLRHLVHTRFALPELEVPAEERVGGLLVCTSRDDDAEWLHGAEVLRLELGALDDLGVRQFLMSDEVVRLVAEATGGRPRALRELLEAALPVAGPAGRAPRGPCALLGRVAALSAPAVRLLEALALFDRPTSVEALRRAARMPAAQVHGALAEALQSGVVSRRSVEAAACLSFLDPGAAEALRDALDEARRAELHLAVGRELFERGEPADQAAAAEHLIAGGGGEEAVDAALVAGRQLEAALDHERAIALYRAVHGLTDRDAVRAVLEGRLVELLRLCGDYAGALETASRLLERAPEDPAILRVIGQLYLLRDDYPRASAMLGRAREMAVRSADRLELARVIAAFAEVCVLEGRHVEAAAECTIGLGLTTDEQADRPEAIRLRLEIRNTLGKVHLEEARHEVAEALFRLSLEEARRHNQPFEQARASINLGIARLRVGDHDGAGEAYLAALKIATAAEDHRHRAFCLQNLGVLAYQRADFSEALRFWREAVCAFQRTGQSGRLAWVALDMAAVYLELGALPRAQSMAQLAERLGDDLSGATVRHKRAIIAAQIARAAGDLEAARELVAELHERTAPDAAPDLFAEAVTFAAWLELDCGDPAAAAAGLRAAAGRLADKPPSQSARARLLLVSGEAQLALGDPGAARGLLLEAAETFHRQGDLDGEWRSHFALGRVAAASGDQAEAERRYRRAALIDHRLHDHVPEDLRAALQNDPSRRALLHTLAVLAGPADAEMAAAGEARRRLELSACQLPGPDDRFERLIGRHPRMRQVYALVDKVARHQSVILIRGESGTGKELLAEAIHVRSPRAAAPFIKVNCAALVETLLLSELFGHERGAFTGAVQRKAGRFEAAHRGTIFLDEIGDISPRTQSALLRVIQEREFERVGSTTPIKVDVRIVCATNRDLEAMVARGEFREDLYYRLNGIRIDLPALRERSEDVGLIAAQLLATLHDERQGGPRGLSVEVLERLEAYRWPGNVRELENVLRSATLFTERDLLTLDDLGDHPQILKAVPVRGPAPAAGSGGVEAAAWERMGAERIGLRQLQEKIEIECITRALSESGGNITRAAELLKMKRPRLSQLIKEHGITPGRTEESTCHES